jgi:hypothetical protein
MIGETVAEKDAGLLRVKLPPPLPSLRPIPARRDLRYSTSCLRQVARMVALMSALIAKDSLFRYPVPQLWPRIRSLWRNHAYEAVS